MTTPLRNNTNLYNEIKKYLAFLQFERKLSANTINAYWHDLKMFADYMILTFETENFSKINSKYIKTYLETLNDYSNSSKKSSSISRTISSIKNFYKYLFDKNLIKNNPMKLIEPPKISKKLPVVLEVEEIDRILDSINTKTKNGFRDKAIISLLYSCGLRVSELIDLKLTNLFLEEEYLKVFGKGSKERVVPIGRKAYDFLVFYINNSRPIYAIKSNTKGHLFLSNRSKPLSRKTVWNIIKICALNAEIDKDILK